VSGAAARHAPAAPAPSGAGAPFILEARAVTVRYGDRLALDRVSFALRAGDRVAVVGPNGAGKTTLFKAVAGLVDRAAGSIVVHGHAPGVDVCVAYVQQRRDVDWAFPLTVSDVVMMGRVGKIGLLRRPGRSDRVCVSDALAMVGLSDLADRQIGELSGGQQQRMFIARAVVQEAEVVLMDEPLTGLDVQSQDSVLAVLASLRARGVSVMVAMHDLELAASHFDPVMLLSRRLIAFGHAADVLTDDNLRTAYGGRVRFLDPGHGGADLTGPTAGEAPAGG
jgi:ABC-type Mn2+/Zn2+ transport system ATPase subunit